MKKLVCIFQSALLLILASSISQSANAQLGLKTYDTLSANQLAQNLAGAGVIISNVIINCDSAGYGTFNGVNSNLGMDEGLLLTSGLRTNAKGPNDDTGITGAMNHGGDADLNKLLTNKVTHDACALEFDVYVTSDTVKFNYIFGSDEYLEFVNTSFNDVFGLFISGPGINGPFSKKAINIALIPGTTTAVAINSVNNLLNSAYYVNNGTGNTAPQDTSPYYIQYDGFTTVLTAVAAVQKCQTYHIKIVVADAGDYMMDSGVFIESGSLKANGLSVKSKVFVENNFPYIVEGCNHGTFDFSRSKVDSFKQVVHYVIGGTATNGLDYTWIPDSVTIAPMQKSASIIIDPLMDGIPEALENVIVYIIDPCSGNNIDSALLEIKDHIQVIAPPDTTICPFDTIKLTASGAAKYVWTPSKSLSIDTIADPYFFPTKTTQYVVGGGVSTCWDYDTLTVFVRPIPPVDAGPDIDLCEGKNTIVTATGASSYLWSPAKGLSDPNIANPVLGPSSSTVYFITGTDSNGCTGFDTLQVFVHQNPNANILESDTTICPGEAFPLHALGNGIYSWTPTSGLSNDTIANPIVIINASKVYTLSISNSYGCTDSDQISLQVYPKTDPMAAPDTTICMNSKLTLRAFNGIAYAWEPAALLDFPNTQKPTASIPWPQVFTVIITDINGCHARDSVSIKLYPSSPVIAGPDQSIFRGDSTQLQASGGLSYIWSPATDLNNPNIPNPEASPSQTIVYFVTGTDSNSCNTTDSVIIYVLDRPLMIIPNAFSPNQDGLNDVFKPVILDAKTQIDAFRIYNRWGNLIYETQDINQGWNGKFNSIDQPVGNYIYFISGVSSIGQAFVKKGNFTLLR